MNQKGVTLATVIVMIIIMIIIATVSIVAGNRLIVNSNEYKESQEIESVKAAVLRKKTEVNMAGSLVPIGESYIGIVNPVIKSDDDETIIAEGWYLLDEESLEKLGIHDVSSRFLVNYDYEVVIPTKEGKYIEEYMVAKYLHELIDSETVTGIALKDKVSGDISIVIDNEEQEVYGTGWYLIREEAFPEEYKEYIKNDYLFQFKRGEYIKMTPDFEEKGIS